MAKRKIKSKARSIQLKRRLRKSKRKVSRSSSFVSSGTWNDFLDRDISVRSLVKYGSITLAFIIVLVVVFMLGRISVDAVDGMAGNDKTMQLSGQAKQIVKSGSENVGVVDEDSGSQDLDGSEDTDMEEDLAEVSNLSDDVEFISDETKYAYEPADDVSDVVKEEEPACSDKVAGFDYAYTKIGISVSNFQREDRGDNWASLSSLKLTVTNNEPCTIVNPTRVKIKMNPVGKGSVWWDDDVYLPDTFRNMHPGETVSEIIPVHVSYSDIYSEKDFRLAVFDDYDIHMGTFKENIFFP